MTAPACGREIHLKDAHGTIRARYIAMCGERWLKIANGYDGNPDHAPNGLYMAGWQGAVQDLLTYVIVRRSHDEQRMASVAQGAGPDGLFYSVNLVSLVDSRQLAALIGAEHQDMRQLLAGYALIRDES